MIRAVVAMDTKRGIGLEGGLPWGRSLPGDLQRFKALTLAGVVIVGGRTARSLPPLPGRVVVVVKTREEFKAACRGRMPIENVWIGGGGAIYGWAIEFGVVQEWHVTRVGSVGRPPTNEADVQCPIFEDGLRQVANVKGADENTRWEVWR